jgi:general secretion pathway protein E
MPLKMNGKRTRDAPPRRIRANFAARAHHWFTEVVDRSADDFSSRFARDLLTDAIEARATDIHFEPENDYSCVRFRIDGVLYDVLLLPWNPGTQILGHLKALARIDPTPLVHPAEGRCEMSINDSRVNLRISCVPCISGEMMAIRLLDTRNLQLEISEIGFSAAHLETVRGWLTHISRERKDVRS